MTFEQRLRELEAKATKGPWTRDTVPTEYEIVSNMLLILALRNHAPEIATVIEAARSFFAGDYTRTIDELTRDAHSVKAALAALDKVRT